MCRRGGLLYVDDKAPGIHEGYLATPITTIELLSGMVIAGAIKAVLVGVFIAICGSLIAGVAQCLSLGGALLTAGFIALFSVAMVTLVSALTLRVRDPLVARGIFSILNLLLFFPGGALYPVASVPPWLKAISVVDPFTYAVHGLRSTLLEQAPAAALELDAVVLALFSSAWSQRMEFPHGVASGDVSPSSAVIWTRASGDATLTNEVSGTPGFEAIQFSGVSAVTAESDYTAKVLLSGLVPDRKYYYRWSAGDETSVVGTFRTPPIPWESVDVRFVFSGDSDGTRVNGAPAHGGFNVLDAARRRMPTSSFISATRFTPSPTTAATRVKPTA